MKLSSLGNNSFAVSVIVLGLYVALIPSARAQQPILSPRDSVELIINGKKISVNYARPSMHGRRIIGEFVPYNKVWRTGGGKATTFVTEADLRLGDVEIPKGTYTLYTLPLESQWKLIINKQTGQWGTIYNPELDLARVNLKQRTLNTLVEKLKFNLEKTGNGSGIMRIEWEYAALSIPFKILEDSFTASPRDSVEIIFAAKKISVNYGRPSRRGRKIIGGVVPYNEVWRTGANEATKFVTEADLTLGGAEIPKGAYSLYSLPSPKQWKLIINKQVGQFGTEYDRTLDLARVPLKRETLKSSVEKFTILVEKTGNNSGVLKLLWEYTMLSVSFAFKENATSHSR